MEITDKLKCSLEVSGKIGETTFSFSINGEIGEHLFNSLSQAAMMILMAKARVAKEAEA